MKFLTQGFARGFFRNADARPAKLRITKFTDDRPYAGVIVSATWRGGVANFQNLPKQYPSPFPEGTTEWFLDECVRLRAPIKVSKPAAPLTIGECIARLRALP